MAAARWPPATLIGCFGLTEPDFGSNPRRHAHHRAQATASGWVLNGEQALDHHGRIADVALVWAQLDGRAAIRGFLVERGTPGFTDARHRRQVVAARVGHARADPRGLRVPARRACCPASRGMQGPAVVPDAGALRHLLGRGRRGDGLLRRGAALRQGSRAVQRPLAGYQLVQQKLVDMVEEITKAQLLALRLGRLKEAGKMRPQQVSLAKRNNVRDGARHRARRARPPRRQRRHRRVPVRPPHVNLEIGLHLRGHPRHPHAHRRPGRHRHRRVRIDRQHLIVPRRSLLGGVAHALSFGAMTYVALLRGINVGGKNMLPMATLAAMFARRRRHDVRPSSRAATWSSRAPQKLAADRSPRASSDRSEDSSCACRWSCARRRSSPSAVARNPFAADGRRRERAARHVPRRRAGGGARRRARRRTLAAATSSPSSAAISTCACRTARRAPS